PARSGYVRVRRAQAWARRRAGRAPQREQRHAVRRLPGDRSRAGRLCTRARAAGEAGGACAATPQALAVILVDTGPLVALFDPRGDAHAGGGWVLATLRQPLVTTVPVRTAVLPLPGP